MHISKIFTYIHVYWFKLFHCYGELNTGVAVGFARYTKAAESDARGYGM